ncbi:MAG: M20 family peptidase [Candidatus Lokiarchaeota archaeon]|nr:M20 family peptidase [Candidatus Lokiarchaeota archaeon]
MNQHDLIKILRKLVQFPTVNPPGKTKEIIDYLISEVFMESKGFFNEVIPYHKKDTELHNLVSKIGIGPQKIIFSGHFDVVPAGDLNLWRFPPFSAEIMDGKLFGRGACDMKAGIVMLIGTIMKLLEYPKFLKKYTLVFLGSADEEAGMTGAYTCTRKGVMKDAILLIVGEPTNMKIGIAEKGLLWLDLEIEGKAAHASTPHSGLNSIEGALNLIPKLYKCIEDKENPVLGRSTLNIGTIQGGIAHNIVPEKTLMSIDYRLVPEQDLKLLINNLRNLDLAPYNLKTKVTLTLPAIQTDINHPFLQNLKKLANTEFIGLSYATDIGVLIQPKNPIPFLIYGPGDPEVVHKENEHIVLEDIFKSIELLTGTLLKTYLL